MFLLFWLWTKLDWNSLNVKDVIGSIYPHVQTYCTHTLACTHPHSCTQKTEFSYLVLDFERWKYRGRFLDLSLFRDAQLDPRDFAAPFSSSSTWTFILWLSSQTGSKTVSSIYSQLSPGIGRKARNQTDRSQIPLIDATFIVFVSQSGLTCCCRVAASKWIRKHLDLVPTSLDVAPPCCSSRFLEITWCVWVRAVFWQ